MLPQDSEMPSGWPLGLGSMNMRLRLAERNQAAAAAAAEPNSSHLPSYSFSSVSSSNLDTESTASFFPDQSVSLGRLIGIKPGNRGRVFNSNTIIHFEQHDSVSHPMSYSRAHEGEASQRLCVPLLHSVIEKLTRTKSSLRH